MSDYYEEEFPQKRKRGRSKTIFDIFIDYMEDEDQTAKKKFIEVVD